MDATLRSKKLKEIMATQTPYARKDIHYRNKNQKLDVWDIPLEYLIFNQYNGRIATFVKTYEKQHHPIDVTTDEGEKLISNFLWESKKDRNKITQKDIADKGQLEYGIVTADGVVIDGNRRFMLLKKNKEKNKEATAYFKAIILEDTFKSNKNEIMRLETTYQMGVDDKVDYNPIQKYLKCRDLIEQGFRKDEIAEMMGEDDSKIEKYLSILELMDEYLEEYEYEGMYRVLEVNTLETHFMDLERYLSRYRAQRQIQGMDWSPKAEDIDDLKRVYFDYMRAGFEARGIRVIANSSKGQGIFTKKDLWKGRADNREGFVDSHFNAVKETGNEKSLQEMREESPDLDAVALISSRDSTFKKKIESHLKENRGRAERDLEDQNSKDEPLELMHRAKRTLEKINTNIEDFGTQKVFDKAKEINQFTYELMQVAKDKMKTTEAEKKK